MGAVPTVVRGESRGSWLAPLQLLFCFCFGTGVAGLGFVGFAGLGVGGRQMEAGLLGRNFGAQLSTLLGGPCREILAFMDLNIKSGDFQDFLSSNSYWRNDSGSWMARFVGCGSFGQHHFRSKCSAFMDLNIKSGVLTDFPLSFPYYSGRITVPSWSRWAAEGVFCIFALWDTASFEHLWT